MRAWCLGLIAAALALACVPSDAGMFGSGATMSLTITPPPPPPAGPPANTVAPTISGTPQEGTSTNSPISYTYVWGHYNGAQIAGATSKTYMVQAGDVALGAHGPIVRVTATNAAGTSATRAVSAATAAVTAAPVGAPVNTVAPKFSTTFGQPFTPNPLVGTILQISGPGTWSNCPCTYTYQWYRGSTRIGGRYYHIIWKQPNVASPDLGQTLSVVVTATNSSGSSSITIGPTGPVAMPTVAPTNSTPPSISGLPYVGKTLVAGPGLWSSVPYDVLFQWYRGSMAIAGATNQDYVTQSADQGQVISVQVTAQDIAGNNLAATPSSNTLTIAALPAAPLGNCQGWGSATLDDGCRNASGGEQLHRPAYGFFHWHDWLWRSLYPDEWMFLACAGVVLSDGRIGLRLEFPRKYASSRSASGANRPGGHWLNGA